MPARTVEVQKARRALITDVRFNHPDAAIISDRYLPRLIALSQRRVTRGDSVAYVDILWLQIALGLEALANGYPHLPKSDDRKEIISSLKRSLAMQQREMSRLPRVSHENVELGNLSAILSLPLVKTLKKDLSIPMRDVIQTDPGCILSALVTYWLH